MSVHEPGGRVVCIHSVVVSHEERRKGVGKRMMEGYLGHLRESESPVYERVLLLSKPGLVPFYESVGFTANGPSKVQHGQETWIEMAHELRPL